MKALSALLILALFVMTSAPAFSRSGSPIYSREQALILPPPDYDPAKKYPVLVVLPYTGGSSSSLLNNYYLPCRGQNAGMAKSFAKMLAGYYPDKSERQRKSFFIILPGGRGSYSDHTTGGFSRAIARYEKRIKTALERLGSEYNIDRGRVFLAGFSLGGDLSWALALKNSSMFKGAIIMGSRCSYEDKAGLKALAAKKARFYLAIGGNESTTRLNGIKAARRLLTAQNIANSFYTIPNRRHAPLPADKFKEALEFAMFE